MESFRSFVEKIQEGSEEIQERRVVSTPVATRGKPDRSVTKDAHKDIEKLWKKFLDDVTKAGYIVPRGHSNDQILLHNTKFSSNELAGRHILRLPKNLLKFVKHTK